MKEQDSILVLLAPSSHAVPKYFVNIDINANEHSRLITETRNLCEQVYQEEGFLHQQKEDSVYSQKDVEAWHLIAKKRSDGTVFACIRIFLFDDIHTFPSAETIFSLGGVEFTNFPSHTDCLALISNHLEMIKKRNKPFVYIGGLSVNRWGQKVGYGAILGLAVNAFCRIANEAEGLTFAQSDKGGTLLFQRLGGYLLDNKIEPSYCQRHRCNLQLIGLKPCIIPSKAERIIRKFIHVLQSQPVLTLN